MTIHLQVLWSTDQLLRSQTNPSIKSQQSAEAEAVLSGHMGTTLGLVGRCGSSAELGEATVARFQA